MDSKEPKKTEATRFFTSFRHAAAGIAFTFKHERNFQIHCFISVLAAAAGIYFHISAFEWVIVLILIAGMLSLELMNTAVEKTVDLVSKEYRPLAKAAKDAAAGSVLVFAILSFILGLVIFLPKIFG